MQSTGAAAYKALKGDATLAEVGTLTVANGAVTSAKMKPTMGVVPMTGESTQSLTSTTLADVTGTTKKITPAVASTLLVTACFESSMLSVEAGKIGAAEGGLSLDGLDQTGSRASSFRPQPGQALQRPRSRRFSSSPSHWRNTRSSCARRSTAHSTSGSPALDPTATGFSYFLAAS